MWQHLPMCCQSAKAIWTGPAFPHRTRERTDELEAVVVGYLADALNDVAEVVLSEGGIHRELDPTAHQVFAIGAVYETVVYGPLAAIV